MEPVDEFAPEPRPPADGRRQKPLWPFAVALAAIVLAVIAYFVLRRDGPAPPAEPAAAAPPAAEQPAAEPPSRLPPPPGQLDGSDDWVRRAVAALSSHPALARWLVTDDLVRRFTAAVDNVAAGQSPRPHLGFLGPAGRFAVAESGGEEYIDPASFARYDRIAQVVDSLDEAGTVQLYRQLRPLIRQAYADLGYPDADFDRTLRRAVEHLLAAPVPRAPIELEPEVAGYRFADPALESLSAAQKHLLRMGPANARLVQAKLRALLAELDAG